MSQNATIAALKVKVEVYMECQRGDLALEICDSVLHTEPDNREFLELRKVARVLYEKGFHQEPRREYKMLLVLIEGHLGGCPIKVLDAMAEFKVAGRGYICPKCEQASTNEHKLVLHFLEAHKDLSAQAICPFSCQITSCKLHFPHKFHLVRHIENVHSANASACYHLLAELNRN